MVIFMKKFCVSLRTAVSLTLMMFLLACSGSALDSTGKTVKGAYTEYLNPPAEIDYEQTGSLEARQFFLAEQQFSLNRALNEFLRELSNSDTPPTPDSVVQFLASMPWLNGIAAVDLEGLVLAQEPTFAIKQIDFSVLAAFKPRPGAERVAHAFVAETLLGPEIVAVMPVYVDAIKQGYFAAHFDMGNLMQMVPAREYFLVFTPEALLWEGDAFAGAESIRAQDWKTIAREQVSGTVESTDGSCAWVSYFVGDVPLIFVLSATAPVPKELETDELELEETEADELELDESAVDIE